METKYLNKGILDFAQAMINIGSAGVKKYFIYNIPSGVSYIEYNGNILDNFTKFATNYGGITLTPTVILQAAGQIEIRETVAGFVGAPLPGISGYFD